MRRLNSCLAFFIVLLCVVVAPIRSASAQPAPSPRIFSAVPDVSGSTLVVSGTRFGVDPEVWVERQQVSVLPGATDERLEIDVPAAWRMQPGTYRLVVRTAAGLTDRFDVALGGGVVPSVVENGDTPFATKVGYGALFASTGLYNTAAGYAALFLNTNGNYNTAAGALALLDNDTGVNNTAVGYSALLANTIGASNTAVGNNALYNNVTGNRNVALGFQAGYNATGSDNVYVANLGVATDSGVIRIGTPGTHWDTYLSGWVHATAFIGDGSGLTSVAATTAANASALGGLAPSAYAAASHTHAQFGAMLLQGGTGQNTALGTGALGAISSGTGNLALGYQAGNTQTTGSNNVYVANAGVAGESNIIRIGTPGTHTDIYLAGTVHIGALAGPGSGDPTETLPPAFGSASATEHRATLAELESLRRTIRAQAGQLAAEAQQRKTLADRLEAQDRLLAALLQRLATIEARLSPPRAGIAR